MIIKSQDIALILGIITGSVGFIISVIEFIKSNRIKRAQYLKDVLDKLRTDTFNTDIEYLLEYDVEERKSWYNEKFHHSDLEKKMDRFLSNINYFCYLRNQKIIGKREFKFLRYEIERVCLNEQVQAYLWNLYHYSLQYTSDCPFQQIIDYGIKNNLFRRGFQINRINLFKKMLKF